MIMGNWLAKSPLASAAKVFVAVLLGVVVADWVDAGTISFDKWQTWVIAGLASAVPVLINWLNPSDPRYGRNAGDS